MNLAPCGTPAAYKRHLRRHETPCHTCRNHNRKRTAAYNAAHPNRLAATTQRRKARHAALRDLAALHPAQYQVLYAARLTALGADLP